MNDTTNTPGRRRKSSGGRKAIIAAVVVALAGGGYYGWHTYKASKSKEGEYITARIEKGNIEDLVTSTGTLQPLQFVDVGAQVSGQIQKLYVEVGDVVQKGDVLAEIDATTAEAKVEQMRAQLLQAETNLEDSMNSLEKAERDAIRQKNLYEAGASTKEAKLNADTALTSAQNRIKTQKASIAVQKAQLTIEERNLGYTKITAPQLGTVMSIKVKEGQTVNATQTVPNVLQIADLTTMTVQSEVSEADVAKLYKGIPVYFTTLSDSNKRWYSTLKRIEPTPKVQNSVVLYNALFDVENDEGGNLRPQMTTQVFFVGAQASDVLMVPMAAIQQGQQIARELAQKEREKNGNKAGPAGAGGPPGGPPGGMPGGRPGAGGATGAAPAAAGPAAANTAPGGAREGGATAAANTAAPGAGSAPAAGSPGAAGQGNRPNGQGNRTAAQGEGQNNRQGMRNGQAGGDFNGPRPGAGGPGGFQNMTPEEREKAFARMRQGGGFQGGAGSGQRMGGFGGQRGGAGNAAIGSNGGGAAAGPRPAPRRNGTVMVKKADGTLEARRIVYGITNRVHAQVLEGLTEGEEVIVGKRESEAASASTPRPNNNNNNNNNFQNNRGGGNFQGGGNFPRF
jgi:macrolide-specific efflux system membrane fusion protein